MGKWKVPDGKEQIHILLDKDIAKKLRKYIQEAYPTYTKGLLSIVVQDALASYLNARMQQHTANPINPGLPFVQRVCQEIKLKLYEKGLVSQASLNDITQAISEARGSDPRTIKKWITTLLKLGYLKQITLFTYEIV